MRRFSYKSWIYLQVDCCLLKTTSPFQNSSRSNFPRRSLQCRIQTTPTTINAISLHKSQIGSYSLASAIAYIYSVSTNLPESRKSISFWRKCSRIRNPPTPSRQHRTPQTSRRMAQKPTVSYSILRKKFRHHIKRWPLALHERPSTNPNFTGNASRRLNASSPLSNLQVSYWSTIPVQSAANTRSFNRWRLWADPKWTTVRYGLAYD